MENTLLFGRGSRIISVSDTGWKNYLDKAPERAQTALDFMTDDHFRIRYFLVTELPRVGEPISPTTIAQHLALSESHVIQILDELEAKLFFLVRDNTGAVAWAFPITVTKTAWHLTFSSGEKLYAA